jgi:hypothetical protein
LGYEKNRFDSAHVRWAILPGTLIYWSASLVIKPGAVRSAHPRKTSNDLKNDKDTSCLKVQYLTQNAEIFVKVCDAVLIFRICVY